MQDPHHDNDDNESNQSADSEEDPDCVIPDKGEELDDDICAYLGGVWYTLVSRS